MSQYSGRPIPRLCEVQETVILRNKINRFYLALQDIVDETEEIEQRFISRAAALRRYPSDFVVEQIAHFNRVYNLLFEGEGISLEKIRQAKEQAREA